MKERLLREESGFSLPEMLVTIVIMIIVFLALYSVFDMSVRIFMFGNNKAEAMESARLGVEKMEREIRGAYKYNSGASPSPQNHLFFTTADPTNPLTVPPTTVSQLTFGNDMGGPGIANGKIECDGVTPCEYITYKLTDGDGNTPCNTAPCTLRRVNTDDSNELGDPVVEDVAADGLTFTLLQSDGATLATSESGEGEAGVGRIEIVLVNLETVVDVGTNTEGTQTLTTAIDLRNRQ
jgi:prepilin-type N-terminal cleavage/methylation domain-containing protein